MKILKDSKGFERLMKERQLSCTFCIWLFGSRAG